MSRFHELIWLDLVRKSEVEDNKIILTQQPTMLTFYLSPCAVFLSRVSFKLYFPPS